MPEPAFETKNLSKEYGGRRVLRKVSVAVQQGEAVALLGPNGAGKTTLLRILATLLRQTSGEVRVFGMDPAAKGSDVRRRIGVLSHQSYLYDELTAAENLRFYARMYDVPHVDRAVADGLSAVGLADRAEDRVRTFSRGMQQRLAFARASIHKPDALLLDEPDSGLDPGAAERLGDLISASARTGQTVLLSTHDVAFARRVAGRILVLRNGMLAMDSPVGSASESGIAAAFAGAA